MKIGAFVAEIFAKQYWCFLIIDFQCIFHIIIHLRSLLEIDNYLIITDFFLKLDIRMYVSNEKRTPVSAYRLLSSPSNKQIVFVSSHGSPCIIVYASKQTFRPVVQQIRTIWVIRVGW